LNFSTIRILGKSLNSCQNEIQSYNICTASESLWENVGQGFLDEVLRLAKEHGAAQSVVVCGHLDEPKRAMLAKYGYSIASEWYVRDL